MIRKFCCGLLHIFTELYLKEAWQLIGSGFSPSSSVSVCFEVPTSQQKNHISFQLTFEITPDRFGILFLTQGRHSHIYNYLYIRVIAVTASTYQMKLTLISFNVSFCSDCVLSLCPRLYSINRQHLSFLLATGVWLLRGNLTHNLMSSSDP